MLEVPALCHPSFTGAATSCLSGAADVGNLHCPRGWGDVPDPSWWNPGAAHSHRLALPL